MLRYIYLYARHAGSYQARTSSAKYHYCLKVYILADLENPFRKFLYLRYFGSKIFKVNSRTTFFEFEVRPIFQYKKCICFLVKFQVQNKPLSLITILK